MSILQKIEEIEAEMAKTQKNKATAYVHGCWGTSASFVSADILWAFGTFIFVVGCGHALQTS